MTNHELNRLSVHLQRAYAERPGDDSDAALIERLRGGRDEAAFGLLIRRHGPRVLATCRKVLADTADIDDAFQATFLAFLQSVRTIRDRGSVGAWLCGAAHRLALRARHTAARRRSLLAKRVPPAVEAPAGPDLSWREACRILHEELDRLPEALRRPLMLCYLDGLSRDEAARQLGWSLNKVRSRLERGRALLRCRLERRGVTLSVGLLAIMAVDSVTASGCPPRLIQNTVTALAGRPSAGAAALARGASPTVFTCLKVVSALVLAACVLGGVVGQLPEVPGGPKATAGQAPGPAAAVKDGAVTKAADGQPGEFRGRVLGPDGNPVRGARVYVLYPTLKALPVPERGVTGADGAFRFTLKAEDFDRAISPHPWRGSHVVVKADGYALGWTVTDAESDGAGTSLTVRLGKDDAPLTGRVLSLEGRPLAGVTVRLTELMAPLPGKDLGKMAADLKARQVGHPVLQDHVGGFGGWLGRDAGVLFPPVQTGPDGRFRLAGVGPERVVALRFEAEGVEGRCVRVLTRAMETVTVPESERGAPEPGMTFVGNGFDLALAPGRTVTGVVTDQATGRPIPGAVVTASRSADNPMAAGLELSAVAGQDGRYTLHGLPVGKGNVLRAGPPEGQPYLMRAKEVPVPAGLNPASLDFELARGVALTVKVTDADTGKPVPGFAEHFTFPDNPVYRGLNGYAVADRLYLSRPGGDATFRLVIPAGPGLVAFRAAAGHYPVAVGLERFKDRTRDGFIETVPDACHPASFSALVPVEPKAGARAAEVAITLRAGRSVKGRVLDPEGRPLAGAAARGLRSVPTLFSQWAGEPLAGAEFEATAVDPARPRLLAFVHTERQLAGVVRVREGEKGPVDVKLRPWATLVGRLVDEDGKPQPDVRLEFVHAYDEADPSAVGDLPDRGGLKSGKDGRFKLEGFAPGLRYNLVAIRGGRVLARVGGNGLQLKAGEAKDVGDVVIKQGD